VNKTHKKISPDPKIDKKIPSYMTGKKGLSTPQETKIKSYWLQDREKILGETRD